MNKKLVSILIPNYNYGHYLRNCLDSILAQTYQNIEIIFRDNRSTDDSFDIAYEYRKKFMDKGIFFFMAQNKYNFGSAVNSAKCNAESRGDYLMYLSSDDSLKPDFIEKCVNILDANPDVGLVMTHRDEVDDSGNIVHTLPFYNESCIIPGEEQATVFMMAGIAVPSQCMLRRSTLIKSGPDRSFTFSIAGDWFSNFVMACNGDVAYIKEPLCYYRIHRGNETAESEYNLSGIFEHYQLIHTFLMIAKGHNMQKTIARYQDAIEKLGSMCLRYALKMLKEEENDVAHRYLLLAPVLKRNIVTDEKYQKLLSYVSLHNIELKKAIEAFDSEYNLNRSTSYAPPEGYVPLEF